MYLQQQGAWPVPRPGGEKVQAICRVGRKLSRGRALGDNKDKRKL